MKGKENSSNSEIYLVQLPIGDWDRYYKNVFATFDLKTAEKYIERYNNILEKYTKFIEERLEKEVPNRFEDIEKRTQRQIDIELRWYDIKDRHPAIIITEIEIR